MQYSDVLNQLNTLPSTYVRPGSPFTFIQSGRAAALFRYTNASDGLINNLSFSSAQGSWIDAWGELFNVPRNTNETDDAYATRIPATLVSGKGTPAAIVLYILTAFGFSVTLTEDFSTVSWQLAFSIPVSAATFNNVMAGLAAVRPAGVPGTGLIGASGGLYLGSINRLGAARVTGAYMLAPDGTPDLTISAYTNNSQPLLPTIFLTDPTLNPTLG